MKENVEMEGERERREMETKRMRWIKNESERDALWKEKGVKVGERKQQRGRVQGARRYRDQKSITSDRLALSPFISPPPRCRETPHVPNV